MLFVIFTIHDVIVTQNYLRDGKVPGLDDMYGEHFKYCHDKVTALLSIVCNAMVIHEYLPKKYTVTRQDKLQIQPNQVEPRNGAP